MREITAGELSKILKEHERWIDTDEDEGEKADLSYANLKKANLKKAKLDQANLSGANLSEANLRSASLCDADLSGANLSEANLSCAILQGATLLGANLSCANLNKADLMDVNLSGANLNKADLRKFNLSEADLSGANLSCADLYKADLSFANLSEANLSCANLNKADLSYADLSYADLRESNLNKADLSGANLTRVIGLTIEQLFEVKTLCDSELSSELLKQARKKYPHLLEEKGLEEDEEVADPEEEAYEEVEVLDEDEEELSKPKIICLRSTYKKLSVSQVQSMPNVSIRENDEWGFFGHSTINHDYNFKAVGGDVVVIANVTGLMWHQSGTDNRLARFEANEWVEDLNSKGGYAGYHDWRLPTVEEAVSLLESSKKNGDLYIAPVFSSKQPYIWTGDKCDYVFEDGSEAAWYVYFDISYDYKERKLALNFRSGYVGRGIGSDDGLWVRPVRSVE